MNRTQQILTETAAKAAEYLEMCPNPDRMLSGILAGEIAKKEDYIEYLQRKLEAQTKLLYAGRRS